MAMVDLGKPVGCPMQKDMAEVEGKLAQIRDNIESEVALELQNVLEKIREMAIELCPKHSGALASSIELSSEGGSGAVQAGDFYENSIYAGNDSTFNEQGQPTSQYALAVHDGHFKPNGEWVPAQPFLTEAMLFFSDELESAVSKALAELGSGSPSV